MYGNTVMNRADAPFLGIFLEQLSRQQGSYNEYQDIQRNLDEIFTNSLRSASAPSQLRRNVVAEISQGVGPPKVSLRLVKHMKRTPGLGTPRYKKCLLCYP